MADTKVDFYVLGAADPRARLTCACRVAEKAYEQGLRVAVRTTSLSEAAEIDELMSPFSDRSFVPHAVWPAEPSVAEHTPVLIASGALPDSHRDVLVNLAPPNPYSLAALATWRQGHFLNFNGLTRLVGILWPFLTLPFLLLTTRRP